MGVGRLTSGEATISLLFEADIAFVMGKRSLVFAWLVFWQGRPRCNRRAFVSCRYRGGVAVVVVCSVGRGQWGSCGQRLGWWEPLPSSYVLKPSGYPA